MMLYIDKMSADIAIDILGWTYDEPYEFYNNEPTTEAICEMLADSYFAVFENDKGLVGFFCVGSSAQVPNDLYTYSPNFIDIGIGMRPDLTGQGYGTSFFTVVLSYIDKAFGYSPKRLTVAKFNHRAINLYEKFGFSLEDEFIKGSVEFIIMIHRN
ncbi:MAG: GNAT family N-acetyltransferase [Bacillota bacterium]